MCPGSVFYSLIIPKTQTRTKTNSLQSLLLKHKNDDDDDDDLENNDVTMNKKSAFHDAFLLPTLHPAGSSILTSSLSFPRLKIMKFMDNKKLGCFLDKNQSDTK